ncbi:hypothetical protein N7504_003151 [Penicillium tannophilum]|nr:hypothetical protein N7504_003151 [Penicillium tannophilum]
MPYPQIPDDCSSIHASSFLAAREVVGNVPHPTMALRQDEDSRCWHDHQRTSQNHFESPAVDKRIVI